MIQVILYVLVATLCSHAALLTWDFNPDGQGVTGYRVFHGFASRQYTDTQDVGNTNAIAINDTPCGVTHFFAVTAYTVDGVESPFSEEALYTPECPKPDAPGGLRISNRTNFVTLEWSQDMIYWEALGSFPLSNSNGFFRTLK